MAWLVRHPPHSPEHPVHTATLICNLDVALTGLELVHLLGPDHPVAVAAKEAEDIFTELGAGPYLTRLEAARAR